MPESRIRGRVIKSWVYCIVLEFESNSQSENIGCAQKQRLSNEDEFVNV